MLQVCNKSLSSPKCEQIRAKGLEKCEPQAIFSIRQAFVLVKDHTTKAHPASTEMNSRNRHFCKILDGRGLSTRAVLPASSDTRAQRTSKEAVHVGNSMRQFCKSALRASVTILISIVPGCHSRHTSIQASDRTRS